MKKKILVLCTGNACRSQMAHGFLDYYGRGNYEVYSAGVEIHGVNPNAVSMLGELGLDISHHTSNHVDEYSDVNFDYIITVCDNAKESCPVFHSSAKMYHQSFEDPGKAKGTKKEITEVFRKVRDQIKEYCNSFIQEIKND